MLDWKSAAIILLVLSSKAPVTNSNEVVTANSNESATAQSNEGVIAKSKDKEVAEAMPQSHSQLGEGKLLGDWSGLTAANKPGQNFDLLGWSLTLPTDLNEDGKADLIFEKPLSNGFELSPLFYTAKDGGMVFASPNQGAKTSKNTKYSRTELREMLRRGNTRIKVKGISKNNWVFSSAHGSVKRDAGGVGGTLEATLAVNRVSVTGDKSKVGRVIIGQIHATDDEPIRLYYRKLPHHERGSIYFAHEINGGDDIWFNVLGSRSSSAADPEEGVALNEKFSYKISVVEESLYLTLIRQHKPNIHHFLDMSNSGYDDNSQYMYFKAGVYNQNNGGEPRDFVQATFYHLHTSH
ncbi:polysaccharide lyase family 7 protein [Planctobacterium marinum]|uniref:Alginate lyase 2 domain-containing protein n=1 Tax=Planctobacterium marinum TaxID=1631968 RepID=A0AA48HHL4_9ALTE|nr:hypothetical protein MACH26_09750 [Planctobacterium marinum]